ncbi:unnamed protein product [Porites evermanni]|uniref:Myb/SANT-like domain-containing protein n=1 Tax=Porites evermanni TaxID=104178 RepID=A0ABN8M3M9_9CNID|nr:unnamed protein product [Porites evermanni]
MFLSRLRDLVVQCLDVWSHQPAFVKLKHVVRREKRANIQAGKLIAAYQDNYDRLRSTKSSHGKKSVWDTIMEDFLSLCGDAGIETEKTLAQVKEKLFDKYKAVKDDKNKTVRDRRTSEFYDGIDEFMSGSDKVNLKFVKETRVMQVRPKDSPTSSDSGSSDASATVTIADPTTAAVGEKPNEKDDSPCRPKKEKKRASLEGKEAESTILNLMEARQAAIEKADEKDERMFKALLKSQSDYQQRHQEFTLSLNTACSLAGNSIVIIIVIIAIIVNISIEFGPSNNANVVKCTACYDRVWGSPMILVQALEKCSPSTL